MQTVFLWFRRASTVVGFIACIVVVGYAVGLFGGGERISVGDAAPEAGRMGACAAGDKNGAADWADDVQTSDGLSIRVRTPKNYDRTRAYPLLIVYPPAGMDRATSERYYKLTPEATRRGFIVAYSDHVRLSRMAVRMQSKVASSVMAHWCVDESAISLIGHSDGGSIAESALISPQPDAIQPHAIVASAAGIQGKDINVVSRSSPFRLMIVHSRDDEHFPGFGIDAARRFATIEGCEAELPAPDAAGCATFQHCHTASRIDYCETSGPHARWPDVVAKSFAFFTP